MKGLPLNKYQCFLSICLKNGFHLASYKILAVLSVSLRRGFCFQNSLNQGSPHVQVSSNMPILIGSCKLSSAFSSGFSLPSSMSGPYTLGIRKESPAYFASSSSRFQKPGSLGT